MDKPKRLEKIMAMGVLPGVDVHLDRRFPSYVFQVGHSQFAVDEEIAGDIYVRIRH
jgi:DtxR family Mn-dependent transcriptional regulator